MVFLFLLSIVSEDQVDYRAITYRDNNTIIDNNDTNVNEDIQTTLTSRKAYFSVPLLWKKCFVLLLVLFLLTLGTLIVLFIEGNERINNLKNNLEIKEKLIVETENQTNQTMEQSIETITKLQKQNNQTIKEFNSLLSAKNTTIEHLNRKLRERSKERSRINNHW